MGEYGIKILEEFWRGNVEPTVCGTYFCKEYEKLLELICRNEERRLQATMTDEQKERFSHYTDAVREYQITTGSLIFQKGFKLSAGVMMEVMEEQE